MTGQTAQTPAPLHFWMRAETRPNEARAPLSPEGTGALIAAGNTVTVEHAPHRAIPDADYADAGATLAAAGSWRAAPDDAVILGLKELPEEALPLRHRHVMFGHAYKGQVAGQRLLRRFRAGGGTLLDLEYLTDANGRRLAAFGYWAGYAGAVVALMAWAAQQSDTALPPLKIAGSAADLLADLRARLAAGTAQEPPCALVIGALGRAGQGACDLCTTIGIAVTRWDMEETAHGGPYPEVLAHDLMLNCIFARPGTPVFVPENAGALPRTLRVIGDIACDPQSDFSPIRVNDRETDWSAPARRVHTAPPLDVVAIDNLPAMLPTEASADFASQLLPQLLGMASDPDGVWLRAGAIYAAHATRLDPDQEKSR